MQQSNKKEDFPSSSMILATMFAAILLSDLQRSKLEEILRANSPAKKPN